MRQSHGARICRGARGIAAHRRLPEIALRRPQQRRRHAGHHHPWIHHRQRPLRRVRQDYRRRGPERRHRHRRRASLAGRRLSVRRGCHRAVQRADALQLRRKDRTGFRTRGLRGRSNSARGAVPLYPRHAAGGGRKTPGRPATFGEVSARHIDTRVRFDGVRFADAGKTWCDTDPETGRTVATERTIVDAGGNEFTVRSAATCAYAKEPLPSGTGSLYGIIDYFAGKYTLRVTNREVVFSRTATPYTAHSAYQTTPDPGARERHVTVAALPRAYLSVVGCSAPRPTK